MRVLHLCAGNLYGGVERIVAECARSRALDVTMDQRFAVCFDGRLARQIRESGASCEVLGDVRVSRPHTVVRARRRLAEILDADRPDVAVCHSCWTYGLAAPVLSRHGVAAVPWIHDRLSGRTWVERWASLSSPAAVICNSRFTQETVPAVFPRVPSSVLYAPVAGGSSVATDRVALRSRLNVSPETCVVLIASRLEIWKGHRALIDAMSAVHGDWQVWIAGAPQKAREQAYESELRTLCAAKGISGKVRFLGHRDDVPAVMAAADVLCQPNLEPEPFGIVFVEALYAGLPVVTTASGGALEVVTDACGILVPPGDRASLTGALESLVRDAGRRRALGSAGPARAAALCDPGARLRQLSAVLASAGAMCH